MGPRDPLLNLDLKVTSVIFRLVDMRPVHSNVLETKKVLSVGCVLKDLHYNPVSVQ